MLNSANSELTFTDTAPIQRKSEHISSRKSWSALMIFMFSETALKNVKSHKQRSSALVVGKLEFDAKSRGRSVLIGHPRKVISQKSKNHIHSVHIGFLRKVISQKSKNHIHSVHIGFLRKVIPQKRRRHKIILYQWGYENLIL